MNHRISTVIVQGRPVVLVEFVIPDDAPPDIKEGLTRRSLVMHGGRCPCGAEAHWPNRAQRRAGALELIVRHEADCTASDDHLKRRVAQWEKAGNQ